MVDDNQDNSSHLCGMNVCAYYQILIRDVGVLFGHITSCHKDEKFHPCRGLVLIQGFFFPICRLPDAQSC